MTRMTTALSSLLLCVAVSLLGPVCAIDSPVAGNDAPSTRSFKVHYRSLVDAADLVSDVLSPEGILTPEPPTQGVDRAGSSLRVGPGREPAREFRFTATPG